MTWNDETAMQAIDTLAHDDSASQELRRRASALATYASGGDSNEAAKASGLSASRARYWRLMYQRYGLAVLSEDFHPPRPARQRRPRSEEFRVTSAQHAALKALAGDGDLPGEDRRKAALLLLYAEGKETGEIARTVGLSDSRTRYWRKAFERKGMELFAAGHRDAPPSATDPSNGGGSSDPADPGGNAPPERTKPTPQTAETEAALPAQGDAVDDEAGALLVASDTTAGPAGMNAEEPPRGPGLTPDDHIQLAARKIVAYHLEMLQLFRAHPEFGSDDEVVHRMRVAAQRMRIALLLFTPYFEDGAYDTLQRRLQTLRKRLGQVRDLDVLLEHMREYRSSLTEQASEAFSPFLEERALRRQERFDLLLSYLDSKAYRKCIASCQAFVRETDSGAAQPGWADFRGRVEFVAPMLVLDRYFEVLAFAPLLPNASLEQLHELRIRLKHLRYTIEFFGEVLGESAIKTLKVITRTQDYLGELQDAQTATEILTPRLLEFDAEQSARPVAHRYNPAPLLEYLARRQERKYELMQSFLPEWERLIGRSFRKRLMRSLLLA